MDTAASVVYVSPSNGGKDAIGLTIYPVPANNVLNILFNAPASGALSLQLVNSVGEVTYTNKQSISAGNFSTVLDVASQPVGVYVVKIILGSKIYAQKIVIAR